MFEAGRRVMVRLPACDAALAGNRAARDLEGTSNPASRCKGPENEFPRFACLRPRRRCGRIELVFFALSSWALAVIIFLVVGLSALGGVLLGRYLRTHSETLREPFGALQAALLHRPTRGDQDPFDSPHLGTSVDATAARRSSLMSRGLHRC